MTALLEYLIWITRPRTIIMDWPRLSLIKTNSISHKQRTSKNLTLSVILYGFSSVMAFWQEVTARFGLFPSENEIRNRPWTRTMIYLASLATLYLKILLVNFAMPVKE